MEVKLVFNFKTEINKIAVEYTWKKFKHSTTKKINTKKDRNSGNEGQKAMGHTENK